MSKLPQIKPTPLVKFFIRQGFTISRQIGSHARLIHPDGRKITIAIHNKPISLGTFNSILKQAQMNKEIFLKLFKSEPSKRSIIVAQHHLDQVPAHRNVK